jgi:hypothetical protein
MKINPISLIAATLLLTQTGSASAVSVQRGVVNGGVTLRASVPAGSVVNTGDRMAFEYQSRANASMIIFSIDSRGYVHLLHPLYEPETAQANTRYTIPSAGSDFVVDTPTGVEFVFALAISVSCESLTPANSTDWLSNVAPLRRSSPSAEPTMLLNSRG